MFDTAEIRAAEPLVLRADRPEAAPESAAVWVPQLCATGTSARVIHVSGLAPRTYTAFAALLGACESRAFGDVLVSVDATGAAPLLDSVVVDRLRRLASAADILFIGADTARAVWGSHGHIAGRPEAPRHVVVGDPRRGASEYCDDGVTVVPFGPEAISGALVYDPYGEAFVDGWYAALLDGTGPLLRLARAHEAAAAAAVLGVPAVG
ncbi:hypothetical protein [Agromyces seonyuensis]|uniref:Uncharacterized protein n=1 Tax=Agromyces seonyuensis TaxID=2662446 RepID=A0A6I4P136_9MICO|nr:hypothetical protein [Agromyces seonyuensis]MWC00072.1 hypothetical protein [Agromyces seonyuensis]